MVSEPGDTWYTVSVVADKVYEIYPVAYSGVTLHLVNEGEAFDLSTAESIEQRDNRYGLAKNYAAQFIAPRSGTLYINITRTQAQGPATWSITDATDNRVYQYAQGITVGQEVAVPGGQANRWYKVSLQANKYYVVETTGGAIELYTDPTQEEEDWYGVRLFSASGEYYINVFQDYLSFDLDPQTIKVREIAKQSNTTTTTARTLQLGEKAEYSHVFGASLTFKATLQAGKTYEMIQSSRRQFWDTRFEIKDPEGATVQTHEFLTVVATSQYFTASTSGVYYITCTNDYVNSTQGELYSITLSEVTDARICTYAVEITEGQNVVYEHKTYPALWWKIATKAGGTYYVDLDVNNSNSGDHFFVVYPECGSDAPIISGASKPFSFQAPHDGYCYFKSYSVGTDYNGITNSFTVKQLVDQNNPTEDKALQIAPGDAVSTNHAYGSELWYKVPIQGGHVYEFACANKPEGEGINVYYKPRTGEGDLQQVQTYIGLHAYFTPETDGIYYIKCFDEQSKKEAFVWTFSEVTDNRVHQKAQVITLGEEIAVDPALRHPYGFFWYKLDVTAGKLYEVDFSGADYAYLEEYSDKLDFYDVDNTPDIKDHYLYNHPQEVYKSKYLFEARKSGTVYLNVKIPHRNEVLTYKVSAVSQGDNRLCSYATPVTLGQEVEVNHQRSLYADQWYKVSLEAGKSYEVTNLSGYALSMYADGICDSISDPMAQINPRERKYVYIQTSGEYYIHSYAANIDGTQDFTWSISEAAVDNRACEHATEIEFDKPFAVDHSNYVHERWFKANVAAGQLYSLEGFNNYNQEVKIFKGCGDTSYENQVRTEDTDTTKLFVADTTATYYIQSYYEKSDADSLVFTGTLFSLTDNRSCAYADPAAMGDTITGTGLTGWGLWYTVALEKGKYYEFDFTGTGSSIEGILQSSCDDAEPLAQGTAEKILFKPEATGDYLVHVKPSYNGSISDAWSWLYKAVANGDNRLCEFAEPMPGDTVTNNPSNGIREYWYTFEATAGKFYEFGLISSDPYGTDFSIEVYHGCDESEPSAIVSNKYAFEAKEDATFYLRVQLNTYTNGDCSWYAREIKPDGKFCAYPLPVTLGEEMTDSSKERGSERLLLPEGSEVFDAGGAMLERTWYHFTPEKSGIYKLTLPNFETWYHEGALIFTDCTLDSIVGAVGIYGFNNVALEFLAYADTEYKIAICYPTWLEKDPYMGGVHDITWLLEYVKEIPHSTGTLEVRMNQQDGSVLEAPDARLTLYKKLDGAIIAADTLQYIGAQTFRSDALDYGTYLLYAENLGTGSDGKTYLPTWYNQAGVWEDATEIVIDKETQALAMQLLAAPQDIYTGDKTIAGTVYEQGSGTTSAQAPAGVPVSLYREIPAPQSNEPDPAKWELVAKTKTDAQGAYKIEHLPAATYLVLVDLPGYASEEGGLVVDATSGTDFSGNNFVVDNDTHTITGKQTAATSVVGPAAKLYPNPFTHSVVIENAAGAQLSVFSSDGTCVYTRLLTSDKAEVDLSSLRAGTYLFRLVQGERVYSSVLIKE